MHSYRTCYICRACPVEIHRVREKPALVDDTKRQQYVPHIQLSFPDSNSWGYANEGATQLTDRETDNAPNSGKPNEPRCLFLDSILRLERRFRL